MPLSIKNPHTEQLARQVAKEAGETLTEAIRRSLEERLCRLKQRRKSRILLEKLNEILRRVDTLPTLDSRSEDEILGYDEFGAPR
jgi:antitoxin VapB